MSFRWLGIIYLALICNLAQAFPQEDNFAPGVVIGTMGAITFKYFFTRDDAVDAGVEFMDHPWSVFYADYYRHFHGLFGQSSRFGRETSPYVGIGTGGGFWDRTSNCGRWHCTWNANSTGTGNGFFVRFVVGMEWFPRRSSYSVSAEVAPSYLWYPTNGSTVDFVVGARYYF